MIGRGVYSALSVQASSGMNKMRCFRTRSQRSDEAAAVRSVRRDAVADSEPRRGAAERAADTQGSLLTVGAGAEEPSAKARKIDVQVTFPSTAPFTGDRLRQVVWNLLANAVKLTSHAGTVRVALTEVAGDYRIQPGLSSVLFNRSVRQTGRRRAAKVVLACDYWQSRRI